ncbi:unnamed protein product [Prorocentrum cordatum]|uniref:Sialate O-acetylesterase domain-containing protein n=1 Tax=Prorocentrum cordatum TaxID=2364126 RepID=A0ABN9VG83_9DINO|nr:unnamed protein product [Polarella glacialis]
MAGPRRRAAARAALHLLAVGAASLRRAAAAPPPPQPTLVFSAGFSSDAVLQRGRPASVYGFASGAAAPRVSVAVAGADAAGAAVSYEVAAEVSSWGGDSWQPDTQPAPPHGPWVWRAVLRTAAAGGEYTITASDGSTHGSASIERVTFGDVWFCSGQSNMALMTYFTFSADALKEEVQQGKYANVRHFQVGHMNRHYAAFGPQWATTQNSLAAGEAFVWHNLTSSAALPDRPDPRGDLSPFAEFGATCLYFGVELADAMSAQGLGSTPIGLIQSSVGGTQIEAWMSNETLARCSDEAPSGGAVPQNSGALYYGMVAPFVNYSVRGWVWYQGENNVYGDMGSSSTGAGYGCQLPAMVNSWRAVWDAAPDALFGIVTLAADTSEGRGWHMAGMRWSQTANYGVWPNPALPYTFGAQAYDLEEPWSMVGDGNKQEDGELLCCFDGPDCGHSPQHPPCPDKLNCSLPDISTGRYGDNCSEWDSSLWSPALKPLEGAVRANSPSGIPGNNFMGPIHPRVKRPVGRRLALAAARQLVGEAGSGAWTGPTISGCRLDGGRLELFFNSSLLGGEGLMLRPFNANLSSWSEPGRNLGWTAARDSLGTMVCVANASAPELGNATTCMCQGWNYVIQEDGTARRTFWYCEDGPGYRPPAPVLAAEAARRRLAEKVCSRWPSVWPGPSSTSRTRGVTRAARGATCSPAGRPACLATARSTARGPSCPPTRSSRASWAAGAGAACPRSARTPPASGWARRWR